MSLNWDNIVITDDEDIAESAESTTIFASGVPGQAATIESVTVETLPYESSATVENLGNAHNAQIKFGIPRGVPGNESINDTKGSGDTDYVWSADKSSSVIENITGMTVISGWVNSKYINGSGDTINLSSPSNSSNFMYAVVTCQEGDVFTVNGTGGSNPRLWIFADSSYNILSKADINITGKNLKLVAPVNAAYLVINTRKDANGQSFKNTFLDDTAGFDDTDKVWSADKNRQQYDNIVSNRLNMIDIKNDVYSAANRFIKRSVSNNTTTYGSVIESDPIALPENIDKIKIYWNYDILVHPEANKKGLRVYFFDSLTATVPISTEDYNDEAIELEIPEDAVAFNFAFLLIPESTRPYPYTETIKVNSIHVCEDITINNKYIRLELPAELTNLVYSTLKIEIETYSKTYAASTNAAKVIDSFICKPNTKYIVKIDDLYSTGDFTELAIRVNEVNAQGTVLHRHNLYTTNASKEISFSTDMTTEKLYACIYYNASTSETYTVEGLRIYETTDEYEYILNDQVYTNRIETDIIENDKCAFGSNNSLFIKSLLPAYWTSDNYLEGIRDTLRSIDADARFTFITDCHYCFHNSRNSVKLMQFFNEMFHIHHTFDGGDIIGDQWNTTTHSEAIAKLNLWADELADVMYENYHFAFGNHDQNRANPKEMTTEEQDACALTYADVYKALIAPYEKNKNFESTTLSKSDDLYYWYRMHYYVDDSTHKMRYIVMNTGTPRDTLHDYVYTNNNETYIQLNWLYDTLMSTPEGYSVITFGHQFFNGSIGMFEEEEDLPPNPDYEMLTAVIPIARMMIGAKNKLLIDTGGDPGHYSRGDVKTQYSFEKAPNITPICLWCGHHHLDANWVYDMDDDSMTWSADCPHDADDNKILMIATVSDTLSGNATYKQYLPTRAEGDRTEHAFDIVSIDKSARTIYATRVGFGDDRTFTY